MNVTHGGAVPLLSTSTGLSGTASRSFSNTLREAFQQDTAVFTLVVCTLRGDGDGDGERQQPQRPFRRLRSRRHRSRPPQRRPSKGVPACGSGREVALPTYVSGREVTGLAASFGLACGNFLSDCRTRGAPRGG